MKRNKLSVLAVIWTLIIALLTKYESSTPPLIIFIIALLFVSFWFYIFISSYNYTEQEEDNWISIEYQLPEKGQYVLLYGKGGRQFTALFKDGEFQCYNHFSEELEKAEYITHWQPLPKKPKNHGKTQTAC